MRESVRPENFVNIISQEPMKVISPNFGHICTWFIDVLISFWGQKVRGQGHNRQSPENFVNTIC